MSRYTTGKTGGGVGFKVAKPICRVIADNQINIANYGGKNTLNFSVNNYDTSNKKSETAMNYNIVIKVNQANAPLNYRLYRIYNDSSETEVAIDVNNGEIRTTSPVQIQATNSETHNYRLEVDYDNSSSVNLAENIKISINVLSEQISI